ncbi:MAG TPA: ATP-binding protein, partial [Thermoanaerobaculia bacterium]|nr:ATP-binding protein [Thermoanaerobaculia bacterium]
MTQSLDDQDQRQSRGHEEVFRAVVENTPDLIARFSRDLRRVYVNPAIERLTGRPASELVGRTMKELNFDPRFADPIERALKEVIETGTERTLEVHLPSPEGERVYQARVVPELGAGGVVEFALVISRDITSIRRDQERLLTLTSENERLNRLVGLGRVAAATSHEFNNVLMGIQSFAELIMRSSEIPRVTQAAERIIRSVRRGSGITQALRAFTSPKPPDRVSMDVRLWLSESFVELERLVVAPVKLDADIAGVRLMIEGDRDQLTLALRNLIANARESIGRREGTIRLGARLATSQDGPRPDEEMAQVMVSDDGAGIEPENIPRLFEPFFTTKEGGTGMGLAIANQIVTLHGGRLAVESEVGKGTTVSMLFPAARKALDLPGSELRLTCRR